MRVETLDLVWPELSCLLVDFERECTKTRNTGTAWNQHIRVLGCSSVPGFSTCPLNVLKFLTDGLPMSLILVWPELMIVNEHDES